ncbi:uncharacterized protein LOC142814492 [Rhipicephalus microplus]|uniref:uncharacterized protein LOC142814485 n=1 Tax=Rhipicephalus microplus TaxID=6941 RepID=UPI003F6CB29C
MTLVDKRLLFIKPPQCFTRFPHSIRERCHWKASEWCHWLLFYAVPCCSEILPQRHLNHFVLLVEAVYILLLEELTSPQVQRAGRLLQEFVSRTKTLYSPRMMTFTLHQLLHLASSVERFGPLWAHSAFVFESGNGRLLKTITGAKGVPNQIVERLVMLQQLHLVTKLRSFETKVKDFTCSLFGYPKTLAVTSIDSVSLFGNPDPPPELTAEEISALHSVFMSASDFYEHFRFAFKRTILHSRHYTRAKKSDSSIVRTAEEEYFVIDRIVVVQNFSHNPEEIILLCKKIVCTESNVKLPGHIKEFFFHMCLNHLC